MDKIIDWQDGFVKISKKDLENLLLKAGLVSSGSGQDRNVLQEVKQNICFKTDNSLKEEKSNDKLKSEAIRKNTPAQQSIEKESQKFDEWGLKDDEIDELKSWIKKFEADKENLAKSSEELNKYCTLPQIVSEEKPDPIEVKIKVYLKRQSLYLGCIPNTLDELRSMICSNIRSSKKIPVDPEDIEMWFIVQDKEKWMIEEYSDFKSGLIYAEKQESKVLRVIIKVTRDNGRESDGRYHSSEDDSEEEHNRQEEIEKFELISEDTDNTLIMREGYVYRQFYVGSTGKVAFYWDDKMKFSCTGRWEINRFITGGDYGKL